MYEFSTLHDVIRDPLKLHLAGSNFPDGDAHAVIAEPAVKSATTQPQTRFFVMSSSKQKSYCITLTAS